MTGKDMGWNLPKQPTYQDLKGNNKRMRQREKVEKMKVRMMMRAVEGLTGPSDNDLNKLLKTYIIRNKIMRS